MSAELSQEQIQDADAESVAPLAEKPKRKRLTATARRIGEAYDKLNKHSVSELKSICKEKYGDKLKLSKMGKHMLIAHVHDATRERVARGKKGRSLSPVESPVKEAEQVAAESQSI